MSYKGRIRTRRKDTSATPRSQTISLDETLFPGDEEIDDGHPPGGRNFFWQLRVIMNQFSWQKKKSPLVFWLFLAFTISASVYVYETKVILYFMKMQRTALLPLVPGVEEGEEALTYTVCNGLSNQLLGHAAHIAGAIASRRDIRIPNAFIINGVQNEKESENASVLKDVLGTRDNAVPLSQIIDTEALLEMIESYGLYAELEPFEDVVDRNEANPAPCDWLTSLQFADDEISQKVLNALKPSPKISEILETSLKNLLRSVDSSHATLSDGICVHHRDGMDWHEHCKQWEGIEDGIWRKNCLNDRQLPLHELVKYRIPAKDPKSWIYYIGDEAPSEQMIEEFKGDGISLVHRETHALLSDELIAKAARLKTRKLSVETHRDLFAVVDYFTCAEIESFIGNSVSTFSANQIASRHGMSSSWYNSRSIPLAPFFPVFNIPVVYTYTEESQLVGQKLLKASILSVRGTFGMTTDIHILYHGSKDKHFLSWLKECSVIVHKHEPKWLDMIETLRQNGDPALSHLFLHKGNYIGTWQRIDIPLFINAEYILFVDSDTIIRNKFGMHDFGLDVTPGIAASSEFDEEDSRPWNIGVCLFNVPKLRETYESFLSFIDAHTDSPVFGGNVSDQGAYLEFYAASVQFLDTIFNVKPYWKIQRNFDERIIIHFHGLKPHDYLKIFMGYPSDYFGAALRDVILKGKKMDNACLLMHDFSKFISEDEENLQSYCDHVFEEEGENKADICMRFFSELAAEDTHASCIKHLHQSHIFSHTGLLVLLLYGVVVAALVALSTRIYRRSVK